MVTWVRAVKHRKGAGLALAIVGVAACAIDARASLGTGIGASPIVLNQPAIPGHSYQLPSAYVVNTGTESAFYLIRVERFGDDTGLSAPANWIVFGANNFQLAPKASMIVPITLNVPSSAALGDYHTHIVASTEASPGGGTVALGAAAATKLMFTVSRAPAAGFSIPWPWPWWGYALAALALVALIALALGRLGFRLQVERR